MNDTLAPTNAQSRSSVVLTEAKLPRSIDELLRVATPSAWLQRAVEEQELLLIDHANCEKKAASTALSLMYRYTEFPDLLFRLSRLAREELRHFEQVVALLQDRNITYVPLSAARYAGALRKEVRDVEPLRLLDTLLVGALIEARSCERFRALAPLLDEPLQTFYQSLLKSEERHFRDYLRLAQQSAAVNAHVLAERLADLADIEAELISAHDTDFRFHSGVPT